MGTPHKTLTPEETANLPWMHIYSPPFWHADARIMGTRSALQSLRDAIDRCLNTNLETECEAFVSDGEGYGVAISIRSMDALEREPLPYSENYAKGR